LFFPTICSAFSYLSYQFESLRTALQQHVLEEARLREHALSLQRQVGGLQADLRSAAQQNQQLSEDLTRQQQLHAKGKQHATQLMEEVAVVQAELSQGRAENEELKVHKRF
jgi:predicted nuclease with TOPRIM domain